ncbi:hypothetical protein F441_09230 [Phytophthora nicotianae CJ01A1]|uniref:Uncharacterized protein n=1 Tax=Phytophthora nicotianae CJ01A1 TaxID=1317063 RepID=W2X0Q3_PHYNI|nr:hypothetical protein F441_09230 [Phytophthora nicotianae CJ01A1]
MIRPGNVAVSLEFAPVSINTQEQPALEGTRHHKYSPIHAPRRPQNIICSKNGA